MLKELATAALVGLPSLAVAQDVEAFVESNILATLYHELGHALIDIQDVPIFGQEEDAADVLSILLVDAFWEEEDAVGIAYDAAFGFLTEADMAREAGEEPVFWDVHGPDEQRYYNLVCIFYGANPDERDDVAEELGLPEERAEWCEDEFNQANNSWGQVLDAMAEAGEGETFMAGAFERDDYIADLLFDEIDALNAEFSLDDDLVISYAGCGEANAFYDPEYREITICTEYVDFLAEMADW